MSLAGEGRRGSPRPGPGGRRKRTPRPPGGGAAPAGQGSACGGAGPLSLEVPVLQVTVLEGEAFLLPLAPLLVVEVDVGALAGEAAVRAERTQGPLSSAGTAPARPGPAAPVGTGTGRASGLTRPHHSPFRFRGSRGRRRGRVRAGLGPRTFAKSRCPSGWRWLLSPLRCPGRCA